MNFLKRLFKRQEMEIDLDQIPNFYDELTERIFDFVEMNNHDQLSTQIILANGKSVLVSHDMTMSHIPRGNFISIHDKDDVVVAMVNIRDISALGRVPKGKHVLG